MDLYHIFTERDGERTYIDKTTRAPGDMMGELIENMDVMDEVALGADLFITDEAGRVFFHMRTPNEDLPMVEQVEMDLI